MAVRGPMRGTFPAFRSPVLRTDLGLSPWRYPEVRTHSEAIPVTFPAVQQPQASSHPLANLG